MHEAIELVFGAGGLLSKKFAGYEPRPQQVKLAGFTFDAMDRGFRLLAEAPTGVGKSIGYLVPAIWHVSEGAPAIKAWRTAVAKEAEDAAGFDEEQNAATPARVIVVTANIALQEQIMSKDIPLLREILPWEFTAAIAKGRANYLCLHAHDENATEVAMEPQKLTREDLSKWAKVEQWKATTERGDVSELPFELGPDLRKRLTMSSDDCTGKACPRYADCYAEKAKAEVKRATVIVCNYHLFFAHLKIAAEFGTGVLPRFDLVIMDEAHEAADVARSFFGFRITAGSFKWALRFLGPRPVRAKGGAEGWDLDPDLRNEILEGIGWLFDDLENLRTSKNYFARLKTRFPGDWAQLVVKMKRASEMLGKRAGMGLIEANRAEELRKASRRCRLLADNLEAGLDPTTDIEERYAFFLEEAGRGKTALCAKPIEVGDMLRARLFEAQAFKSVVCTSATLTTGDGDSAFDFVAKELGAEFASELIVSSPFDFERQALLVVPKNVRDPNHAQFGADVVRTACELVRAMQGRTLLLCTSNRMVKIIADGVRREFGQRFRILVQGDAPRTQLVQQFREDVSSVLVGTRSLWAGVDVSGEALSAVLIDKLPFDPPTDPVLDAMNERDDKTFMSYSVPRAAIALRQGYGRLIRSTRDVGVVVVCDRRLVEKPWAKRIKRALPASQFSRDMADVAPFFAKAKGDA